jgi:hypothetical protein
MVAKKRIQYKVFSDAFCNIVLRALINDARCEDGGGASGILRHDPQKEAMKQPFQFNSFEEVP